MSERYFFIFFLTSYFISSLKNLKNDRKRLNHNNLIVLFNCTFKQIFFNLFFVFPLFIAFPKMIGISIYREKLYFPLFLLEIIFNYYFQDFLHYHIHLLMHKNKFLKILHKKRHFLHQVAGFTSYYCNPIDFILLDLIPVYFGLFVIKAHIYTYYFYIITETYLTVLYRSGMGKRSAFFDFHNKYLVSNFGTDLFMDKYKETYYIFEKNNFI